jgi:hypothetical protein
LKCTIHYYYVLGREPEQAVFPRVCEQEKVTRFICILIDEYVNELKTVTIFDFRNKNDGTHLSSIALFFI